MKEMDGRALGMALFNFPSSTSDRDHETEIWDMHIPALIC